MLSTDLSVGQKVIIGDVVIEVADKNGSRTRLNITAPKETKIQICKKQPAHECQSPTKVRNTHG